MRIEHEIHIGREPAEVFAVLTDPERLDAALIGAALCALDAAASELLAA